MTDTTSTRADKDTRIKERAYELWQQAGGGQGLDQDHWFRAEAEINAEEDDVSGSKAPSPNDDI